uniref:Calmodulin n=1 Tax=Schistocephalus solidus TaxID=70667 RepID=A0A183T3C3_SCHSO
LDKILDEVGFYSEYPDYKEEEFLVLVTLFDYTSRNYQRRTKSDADIDLLPPPENEERPAKYAGREIEKAIMAVSIHFAASVARIRVKEQVGSLRLLLPQEWRDAENHADVMPIYAWYNQLLGKQEVVTTWLKNNNFQKVNGRLPRQSEYTTDEYCSDVFVFNNGDRAKLAESQIVRDKNLIIQDRSHLVVLHAVLSHVGAGEEVLIANTTSPWWGVHLEGLLANKFPTVQPVPQIRVSRQPKEDEDPKFLTKAGSKSTKMLTDDFLTLGPPTEPYKNVRHVILEASDTRSGVCNPVDYIECENDEMAVLKDMWTPPGTPQKETKKLELIQKTTALLKHALKLAVIAEVAHLQVQPTHDRSTFVIQRSPPYAPEKGGAGMQFFVRDAVLPSQLYYSTEADKVEVVELPRLLRVERPSLRPIQQHRQDDSFFHLKFGAEVETLSIPDDVLRASEGLAGSGDQVATSSSTLVLRERLLIRHSVDGGVGDCGELVKNASEMFRSALQDLRLLSEQGGSVGTEKSGGFFDGRSVDSLDDGEEVPPFFAVRVHLDLLGFAHTILSPFWMSHATIRAARTVTFISHSVLDEETTILAQKTMEYSNRTLVREAEAAVAPKKITSAPAFVMRLPIMQIFTEAKDALDSGQPSVVLPSNAVRFPQSDECNGFFFCIFKKEAVLLKQDEEEEPEAEGEEGEEKTKQVKKKPKKGMFGGRIPVIFGVPDEILCALIFESIEHIIFPLTNTLVLGQPNTERSGCKGHFVNVSPPSAVETMRLS